MILIVRHGESGYNAGNCTDLDSMLTKKGMEQAVDLRDKLNKEFDLKSFKVFTSPFFRAISTTQIICGNPFGCYPEIAESPNHYPDGISVNGYDLETDIEKYLSNIKEFCHQLTGDCLIVSHGTPCVILYKLLNGESVDELPEWNNEIQNCEYFQFNNKT